MIGVQLTVYLLVTTLVHHIWGTLEPEQAAFKVWEAYEK